MTKAQQRVYDAILILDRPNQSNIAKHLGLRRETIRLHLNNLIKQKEVMPYYKHEIKERVAKFLCYKPKI